MAFILFEKRKYGWVPCGIVPAKTRESLEITIRAARPSEIDVVGIAPILWSDETVIINRLGNRLIGNLVTILGAGGGQFFVVDTNELYELQSTTEELPCETDSPDSETLLVITQNHSQLPKRDSANTSQLSNTL